MALTQSGLVALTDSGVLIRFPKQIRCSIKALVRELPDGPGDPHYKTSRDSESLTLDPHGRGWWVGFENRDELWLYDMNFTGVLARIDLGRRPWSRNKGIEALASDSGALLLFPEEGANVLRLTGRGERLLPISNRHGRVSDVARLPGGQLLAIHRNFGLRGFSNRLSVLAPTQRGFTVQRSEKLPLGSLDNAEALASEPLPDGRYRLWLMTDDNFQQPLRTLLIVLESR